MSREVSHGPAPRFRAAVGAVVESLELRTLFAAAPAALSQVSITAPDALMSEAGRDTGSFRVTRTGGDVSQPLVVRVTVGGRATNGVD